MYILDFPHLISTNTNSKFGWNFCLPTTRTRSIIPGCHRVRVPLEFARILTLSKLFVFRHKRYTKIICIKQHYPNITDNAYKYKKIQRSHPLTHSKFSSDNMLRYTSISFPRLCFNFFSCFIN